MLQAYIHTGKSGGTALHRIGALLAIAFAVAFPWVDAHAKPKPAKPDPAPNNLPADLNLASLRVTAVDALYQFDFSTEQLQLLLEKSHGAADRAPRPAAPANAKVAAALGEFHSALLAGKDDLEVAKLRSRVADVIDSEALHLNDDVKLTPSATAAAAGVFPQIKASQIAAYLASHAHEVADPVEALLAAMEEMRDLRAEHDSGKEIKDQDVTALIQESAADVGFLSAGLDEAKCNAVAGQVSAYLKSVYDLKEADFTAQRAALTESARKIAGGAPPMQVLGNWLQRQIALLLSNPQLPAAIDEVLAARRAASHG